MGRFHWGSALVGAAVVAAAGVAAAGPDAEAKTLEERVGSLEKQVAELLAEREAEKARRARELEASLYERHRDATPDNRGRFFLVSPAAAPR